jgi:hypothetical protein
VVDKRRIRLVSSLALNFQPFQEISTHLSTLHVMKEKVIAAGVPEEALCG